ncbi:MAG: SMC-Scp complex subunit ScpB [Acidobacteria bacterium]|nr:MAG: SMC-Scp complex subunit ScpB [Acidobacteriota bacterium]
MINDAVLAFIDAALLTSRGPVMVQGLVEALGDDAVTVAEVEEALESMRDRLSAPEHGIRLEKVAGGWRYITLPELDETLRVFHGLAAKQRLSQAALEVLSIVAHRQPVTLPEVNFVRGANSTAVVRTLLDRGLLRLAGRKKVVGNPFLYRTTKEFLVHFGLDRIEELPEPEKMIQDENVEAE